MPRILTLAILLLSLLAPAARAQPADPVTASATPQFTKAHPGDRLAIAVRIDLAEHMHVWPNKPVVPAGVSGFTPVATEIKYSEGVKTIPSATALFDRIKWPASVLVKIAGLDAAAYAEPFTVYVPVIIDAAATPGDFTIPLYVHAQACNDSTCFLPQDIDIPVTLTIVPASEPVASSDPQLFTAFDASVFNSPLPTPTPTPTPTPKPATAPPQPVSWFLIFGVFLCGLTLNLTPCVLPVIPLKIMGLHQQSGSRVRTAWLGLWLFLGVAFFWLVLGGLISLKALGAISELASYWQFNVAVGLFMAVMGLGMFDLFTVGLPRWVNNIEVGHDTLQGSFLFGIMTAVLATPCVGPFAAFIAAGTLNQPPTTILLVFLCTGLGMGLPYLILALFPNLVAWIPRAGPASELLKQVMGLLMIAFAVLFLSWGIITLSYEYPYLPHVLHWWLVGIVIAFACLWMTFRTFRITRSHPRRFIFTLLAAAVVFGSYLWCARQTNIAEMEHLRKQNLAHNNVPGVTPIWDDYSAQAVDKAIADGKVVVLEFTAPSCFICKVLEAGALYTPEVDKALMAEDVRSFKVDLISRKTPGWDRLNALGSVGVPYLVVIGPGHKEPWTRNAYTTADVVDAIKDAKRKP